MDERSPIEAIQDMIIIMGVAGAGKSHFINCLTGEQSAQESHGLQSGTKTCQMVPVAIGADGAHVYVVDTPGFDDSSGSDVKGLVNIIGFLTAQYKFGMRLKGIIYLHRITDVRVAGSVLASFELFRDLCGDQALRKTTLLTTMWEELRDPAKGWDRQHELRELYSNIMKGQGTYIEEFDGSKEAAEVIVGNLVNGEDHVVLKVQEEVGRDGKSLKDTTIGRRIVNVEKRKIDEARARYWDEDARKKQSKEPATR